MLYNTFATTLLIIATIFLYIVIGSYMAGFVSATTNRYDNRGMVAVILLWPIIVPVLLAFVGVINVSGAAYDAGHRMGDRARERQLQEDGEEEPGTNGLDLDAKSRA